MIARGGAAADWVSQEWLLGEVAPWLGTEETLRRTCNVCRAWRYWCNKNLTLLHIGNDFQRVLNADANDNSSGGCSGSRSAGPSIPLFLPIVPSRLRELHLSGAWTSLHARELGTIRRGCRLEKLVITSVRFFSFSYRELLLFECLEELDISDSHVGIPLPRLRFPEPASGSPSLPVSSSSTSALSSTPTPSKRPSIIPARALAGGGTRGSDTDTRLSSSVRAVRRARASPSSIGGVAGGGSCGVAGSNVFDSPKFATTLKRLTAVKTRLWNRWDLSTFSKLSSLEVSFAGRTMLKQLHRKAEMGSRLTELSICDLALRYLVRPTELAELAEAVGGASTFRMRRVDVVKEVSNLAYLRAILGRLHSLQVLELTDVALDDSMLNVLGEVLTSACRTSSSPSSSATAAAYEERARSGADTRGSANGTAGRGHRYQQQQRESEGPVIAGATDEAGARGSGAGMVSLRTLILGRCGGVSEGAFETFLELVGRGGGSAGGGVGARRDLKAYGSTSGGGNGNSGSKVGSANERRSVTATGTGLGTDEQPGVGIALSTLRLQGCTALGDRGLALFCAGAKERLTDIEMTGSLLLTDNGVENLARYCSRLARVDLSGCSAATSNSLKFLLGNCPAIREVKAWGIRFAGNLGGVVQSRQSDPSSILAAAALREAFEARGVGLAWTGPLPPADTVPLPPRESGPDGGHSGGGGCVGSSTANEMRHGERRETVVSRGPGAAGSGAVGSTGGGDVGGASGNVGQQVESGSEPEAAGGERGTARCKIGSGGEDELPFPTDVLPETAEEGRSGDGRRRPCRRACGAWPKTEDAADHSEVCPLATVGCLLRADGCTWVGTRRDRRRHLEVCPMWLVKCPVCCRAVHVREYGGHVLSHSVAGDSPALHPPGCTLRAYGCRACRTTPDATAETPPNAGVNSVRSTRSNTSSSTSSSAGGAAGGGGGGGGSDAATLTSPAAAAAATAVSSVTTEKEEGRLERGGRGHDNPGICPWYRVQCKSCEQEVGRKEWDAGEHACPVQRRVDVLAKHASGAGKLRNRQWLIVYGYIGSGDGKKGTAEGWEDPSDGAFHGVNPMCAMPSVLSSALPLPGPAGGPVSPATPPS